METDAVKIIFNHLGKKSLESGVVIKKISSYSKSIFVIKGKHQIPYEREGLIKEQEVKQKQD